MVLKQPEMLGSVLSADAVAGYASAAGFPESVLATMTAIAFAESSGDPAAVSPPNSNGTRDYGLFQINSSHAAEGFDISRYADPTYNAQWAKRIYDSQGLHAWSTFNNGAYLSFMDLYNGNNQIVSNEAHGAIQSGPSIPGDLSEAGLNLNWGTVALFGLAAGILYYSFT